MPGKQNFFACLIISGDSITKRRQKTREETLSRATNQRRLHRKTPPEPREESFEAREICCRLCFTAKVLPILGPLPAVHETVEPPSTVRYPELSRLLLVPAGYSLFCSCHNFNQLNTKRLRSVSIAKYCAQKLPKGDVVCAVDNNCKIIWGIEASRAHSKQGLVLSELKFPLCLVAVLNQELHQWDRKYRAKFGFEFRTSTELWFSQKILDEAKTRYENTLVVELDVASREEFKLIEHGLERLWDRLSRPKIQEASEEPGEVVPDSIEKEDVVSSDGSDESTSAGRNCSMLSCDLNKTPDENEYPYSGMSPGKKNAWHLANWATRYLNP
ncbi:uncharacterized protein [Arachis hypogaea]|uniref:uncharacterized protein n=1 Tax=Arachis hypogaea TaxID=3818 RepID=UPI003B221E3B